VEFGGRAALNRNPYPSEMTWRAQVLSNADTALCNAKQQVGLQA
jgi:hypothetical protein